MLYLSVDIKSMALQKATQRDSTLAVKFMLIVYTT